MVPLARPLMDDYLVNELENHVGGQHLKGGHGSELLQKPSAVLLLPLAADVLLKLGNLPFKLLLLRFKLAHHFFQPFIGKQSLEIVLIRPLNQFVKLGAAAAF